MKEGRMCTGGRVSEERGNGGGRYGGGKPEGQAGEKEKKGGIRGSSTDGRRGSERRAGPYIGCVWTERDERPAAANSRDSKDMVASQNCSCLLLCLPCTPLDLWRLVLSDLMASVVGLRVAQQDIIWVPHPSTVSLSILVGVQQKKTQTSEKCAWHVTLQHTPNTLQKRSTESITLV
ncbi:uncharacterized protein LOC119697358 isoform X2 [Motacilla alba alba]|uniref:uncharacterized protein LOC119697358 isoform X2 n=1 Tax=Motacilla alba alba TaxID=1094192 RepID=UPI0018D4F5AC|nr:uncharacterized protein LOC119697358 isoform X2 [Motacilla alba alba]